MKMSRVFSCLEQKPLENTKQNTLPYCSPRVGIHVCSFVDKICCSQILLPSRSSSVLVIAISPPCLLTISCFLQPPPLISISFCSSNHRLMIPLNCRLNRTTECAAQISQPMPHLRKCQQYSLRIMNNSVVTFLITCNSHPQTMFSFK